MTNHESLSIPVIQMGHAEKIAEVSQNQRGIQQEVAGHLTAKKLEKQQGQVGAVEKLDQPEAINVKQDGKQGTGSHLAKKRKKKIVQESSKEEIASNDEDSLSGHLVNLNV